MKETEGERGRVEREKEGERGRKREREGGRRIEMGQKRREKVPKMFFELKASDGS